MAKKETELINNLGNEDKLTVQKSRPLFALWQSELTLAEFKILDTYLGRINSHHPEQRIVTFEKGELEEKLGVKKINKPDLELRLKHLMGNVIKITDSDEKKGFRLITLFEEAEAEQDEFGKWKVNLECTQKAMKYIFNIENLGYFQYKLRCVTSITSRYTYILFIYIESHRQLGLTWEIPLKDLKDLLNCTAERYKAFKYFKAEILEKAYKEIHKKTECKFQYETIKKGRSVVAIRFHLENISENLIKKSENKKNSIKYKDVFSEQEIQVLLDLIPKKYQSEQEEFLQKCYNVLLAEKEKRTISNEFNYIKKIIISYSEQLKKIDNTIIRREYDYDLFDEFALNTKPKKNNKGEKNV